MTGAIIGTPNKKAWIEVTEHQVKDTRAPKARFVARVARELPANFTGEFPAWCNKYLVVVTAALEGKSERTMFWECDGVESGLKLIADQFAKMDSGVAR